MTKTLLLLIAVLLTTSPAFARPTVANTCEDLCDIQANNFCANESSQSCENDAQAFAFACYSSCSQPMSRAINPTGRQGSL